jgi:hypothetical protein
VDQKFRAQQLTDRDYTDRLDAIARETEVTKTSLAKDNALLNREDLETLAQIFFGGKGQYAKSSGTSSGGSSEFNFGLSRPAK